MRDELVHLTLTETLNGIEKKRFSSEDLGKACLKRIKKLNPKLNAYLFVQEKVVGIPAAVKDVIITKDIKTTAGSKILENFIPPYQSTIVRRLEENGIGVVGKTNCDEFAMGSSGENSAFGPTKNPWDLNKVPGGSSSGSAAAVAADMCAFALGSDTGGSIRQPSSLCGVVGLKPTYGLVSRFGLIAYASSFDTIGPITKCVEDAALVLEWISGPDSKDSNCQAQFKANIARIKSGVKNLNIGLPKDYFEEGLDGSVREVVKNAIKKLEELGAKVVEISLPHTKFAIPTYYILVASEASSNLARYDGIRFGKARSFFGPEVKRKIMLGAFSLSVGYFNDYYGKAAQVRTLICQDFEKAFERCDAIVGPVSPTAAWNLGEKVNDPLKMYLSDVYTIPASLAGIPGMSVPCGFVKGLPVGLQILGNRFDEETVLRLGYAYEEATVWGKRKPELRNSKS